MAKAKRLTPKQRFMADAKDRHIGISFEGRVMYGTREGGEKVVLWDDNTAPDWNNCRLSLATRDFRRDTEKESRRRS